MTNRETPATIGQRILALRRAAGMSQEALAAAVGVSRQALGKWEADQSLPGLDNLLALAEALSRKVKIAPAGEGGTLSLEFYSKEDLSRLAEALSRRS